MGVTRPTGGGIINITKQGQQGARAEHGGKVPTHTQDDILEVGQGQGELWQKQ